MAFRVVASLVLCAFLSSCAHQGVIVDKTSREYPFSQSVGVGGSFAFMLKDSTGAVHRQLVPPDVFARYEVGQYFNDLEAGPAASQQQQQQRSDGKTMLTAMNRPPTKTQQIASTKKSATARAIASKAKAKSAAKRKAQLAAKRAKERKARQALAAKKQAAPAAQPTAVAEVKAQPAAAVTSAFVTKESNVDVINIVDIGRIPRVR